MSVIGNSQNILDFSDSMNKIIYGNHFDKLKEIRFGADDFFDDVHDYDYDNDYGDSEGRKHTDSQRDFKKVIDRKEKK